MLLRVIQPLLAISVVILCWAAMPLSAGNGSTPVDGSFEFVRENPSVNGERRHVVQFEADGLLQFALVLWPPGEAPEEGWPALLFNHGFHPDPPRYGLNAAGRNDRPGDYYRGVAQAYVDHGLVVVVPDFRGHNDSAGLSYTQREDAPLFYARDSIAAFKAMDSLAGLDPARRYMLGHSMGGLVTLAALDELREKVAAASIWSSMALPGGPERLVNPGVPILVQHARGDAATSVLGSQLIAEQLRSQGGDIAVKLYDSEDHLFSGEDFDEAVASDLAWFARSSP